MEPYADSQSLQNESQMTIRIIGPVLTAIKGLIVGIIVGAASGCICGGILFIITASGADLDSGSAMAGFILVALLFAAVGTVLGVFVGKPVGVATKLVTAPSRHLRSDSATMRPTSQPAEGHRVHQSSVATGL